MLADDDDDDDDAFLGRLLEFPVSVDALRTVDFFIVFVDAVVAVAAFADDVIDDAVVDEAAFAVVVVVDDNDGDDESLVKNDFFADTQFLVWNTAVVLFLFFAAVEVELILLLPAVKKDAIDCCTLCGCALRVAASLSLRSRGDGGMT